MFLSHSVAAKKRKKLTASNVKHFTGVVPAEAIQKYLKAAPILRVRRPGDKARLSRPLHTACTNHPAARTLGHPGCAGALIPYMTWQPGPSNKNRTRVAPVQSQRYGGINDGVRHDTKRMEQQADLHHAI